MKIIAIDTETAKVEVGLLAPPLACMTYDDGEDTGIVHHTNVTEVFKEFEECGYTFVGHRIAYDMAVLIAHEPTLQDIIFNLYKQDRIRDTNIREALIQIRRGDLDRSKLSLKDLAKKYLSQDIVKGNDSWQLRFGELISLPLEQWPQEAVNYASTDASVTYRIFRQQEDSPDETLQTRAAFALHLMAVEGVETDPAAVDALDIEIQTGLKQHEVDLIEGKILRYIKKKGEMVLSKDVKVIKCYVEHAFKDNAPRTAPSPKFKQGQVATDKDTLLRSGDEMLGKLVERNTFQKTLDFLKVLQKAKGVRWNPKWNILVETGRTSCGSPEDVGNLQNQPRKAGVRQCFIPRKGFAYVACDYDTAELRALAQVCYSWFGFSEMRKVFLNGGDPHIELGAELMGISAEEGYRLYKSKDPDEKKRMKEYRQLSKAANFGYPGGLGARRFIDYARGYGVTLTESESQALKNKWLRRWPEMDPYFKRIADICSDYGPKCIAQFKSNRIRGAVSFTQAANTMFQGLVADAAKDAMWSIAQDCYVNKASDLYGSHPVLFIHDEVILETPIEQIHEAAKALECVMNSVAQQYMPDIPITSSAHAMLRWDKAAEAVYVDGRLVPWIGEKKC